MPFLNLRTLHTSAWHCVSLQNIEHPQFHTIRRTATKGLKSYGAGVAALEKVMLETTQDLVDILMQSEKDINCNQLAYGYVCCVISSVVSFIHLKHNNYCSY